MSRRTGKYERHHRHGFGVRVCGLLAFLAILAAVAGTSAKYLHETKTAGEAVASEFYFTSDLLDGQTHTVAALEADGTASVTFRLQNHADALRYSAADIAYTVTVDKGGIVSPASGTIKSGEGHDVDITLSGLLPGEKYTVTAQSTGPYGATLTGTVAVAAGDSAVHCETVDREQYIEVTVWTADYAGNVVLTYPAGLIPDNTDSRMADWTTGGGERTFPMEANSAHVFRFFKGEGYDESGVTADAAK